MAELPSYIPEDQIDPRKPNTLNRRGLLDGTREFVLNKKTLVVGALVAAGGPYVAGLMQGLSVTEAALYGTMQLATIASDNSPDADFARHFLRSIVSRDSQEFLTYSRLLYADMLETYKHILVDAGLLGIAVGSASRVFHQNNTKQDQVREGRAELKPIGEHGVILGGTEGSNIVTDLMQSGKGGFVPVFGSHEGAIALINASGNNLKEPFFVSLGVPDSGGISFLQSNGWSRLKLGKENLIQTKDGKRYLLVVGVGMKPDRELSFENDNVGLSQDALRSASLRLRQSLSRGDLVETRDVIDVYVGNGEIEWRDLESDGKVSDRKKAKTTGVDIYVDTWDVALKALCNKLLELKNKKVKIGTTRVDKHHYNSRFSTFFKTHPEYSELEIVEGEVDHTDFTWVAYEPTSEETFIAARQLRKTHPNADIVALTSRDLSQHIESGGLEDVHFINTSGIIAEMLLDVKYLLREGYTPDQIQNGVDNCVLPIPKRKNK